MTDDERSFPLAGQLRSLPLPTAFRGYNRDIVRSALAQAADAIEHLEAEREELREAGADLESRSRELADRVAGFDAERRELLDTFERAAAEQRSLIERFEKLEIERDGLAEHIRRSDAELFADARAVRAFLRAALGSLDGERLIDPPAERAPRPDDPYSH